LLRDVQNWNMVQIQEAADLTEKACGPRFVTQCLKAIFFFNGKLLSGYEHQQPHNDLRLRIPAVKDFVYDVFLESARSLYRNPLSMSSACASSGPTGSSTITASEIETGMEVVYGQIVRAIDRAIERSFPYEDFLRTFDTVENSIRDDEIYLGAQQLAAPPASATTGTEGGGAVEAPVSDDTEDEDEDEDEDDDAPVRNISVGGTSSTDAALPPQTQQAPQAPQAPKKRVVLHSDAEDDDDEEDD